MQYFLALDQITNAQAPVSSLAAPAAAPAAPAGGSGGSGGVGEALARRLAREAGDAAREGAGPQFGGHAGQVAERQYLRSVGLDGGSAGARMLGKRSAMQGAQGAQAAGAGGGYGSGQYGQGRLLNWARNGTAEVDYQGLTPEQLRAVGGAGATRLLAVDRAYGDREEQLGSDPSMTLLQRNYARGLNTREATASRDAVNKEVEAALAGVMQEEAKRRYDAGVRNANLTREDLELLAKMYQGFIGQQSTSSSSSTQSGRGSSSGFGFQL